MTAAGDPQKQREALSKLGQLFAGSKAGQQQPKSVVKMLEAIGIEPVVMTVNYSGEPTDCLVIPLEHLVDKEYEYLTGVDLSAIKRGAIGG